MSADSALLIATKIEWLGQSFDRIANAISSRPFPYDAGDDIVSGAFIIAVSIVIGFVAHAYISRKR